MGRRVSRDPWTAFCERLTRLVQGQVMDFGLRDGRGSARLVPQSAADVRHAHALCVESGVLLALEGLNYASSHAESSVLWVEVGAGLSTFQPLPGDDTKWFVQPGCLLGDLANAGLHRFQDSPPYTTVAAWLADRSQCNWRSGQTWRSGLLHASVLLADGSQARLGPFGEKNRAPLDTMSLQRLVPALFGLMGQPAGRACRAQEWWPARYRLDALAPEPGHEVNLAHLLLGHGGDLAWVDWLVFEKDGPSSAADESAPEFSILHAASNEDIEMHASDVDEQVKALFDPDGLYPHPGQDL